MNLTSKWRRRLTRIVELIIITTGFIAAVSLWQWYQRGGGFEAIYVAVGVLLAVLWTARRWLRREGEPVASPTTASSLSPRTRENLLNHMQTAWIDGFLKQSLHHEVLKLALHHRPDAVAPRPWQLTLREPGKPDAPVPPDRSLLALFTASGRSLLILGEPGSGKTITMLQLAETLIAAARKDDAAPVPIILNLSSWAQAQKPLGEWMAEELFVQYGLSCDLTRAAIAQNQFLYLLDGLDEVAAAARMDCLAAINDFKQALREDARCHLPARPTNQGLGLVLCDHQVQWRQIVYLSFVYGYRPLLLAKWCLAMVTLTGPMVGDMVWLGLHFQRMPLMSCLPARFLFAFGSQAARPFLLPAFVPTRRPV